MINKGCVDDITAIVIFFDKKSITKNIEMKEPVSNLQNILSKENIIDEVSEEYLGTGQTFGQSADGKPLGTIQE
jgi:hypothetical protein